MEKIMKNLRISFGLSELLVVFSYLMFSTSKAFSITAFCLAIFGKLCVAALELNKVNEEQKRTEDAIDKLGGALSSVLGGNSPKKNSGGFH